MREVPGYTRLDALHSGRRSDVGRARRASDGERVVVKVAAAAHPDSQDDARLEQDFRLGSAMPRGAAPVYIELAQAGTSRAVIMRDEGFVSLDTLLRSGRPGTLAALDLALMLAEALALVHSTGIVHGALSPHNVLARRHPGAVRVIDYSVAFSPGRIVGRSLSIEAVDLTYASPERVGRFEHPPAQTSDMYSLGALAYQMLTGHPPFETHDPLELAHAHVGRTPAPASSLRRDVPEQVSRVVAKLLEKHPSSRYQTAEGVAADLRRCRSALAASGTVPPFELAAEDVSPALVVPAVLYGREVELARLDTILLEAAGGRSGVVAVEGPPGVGKTSLVAALRGRPSFRDGVVCAGKFDQLQRRTPYTAWTAALRSWLRATLAERDSVLAAARDRIRDAVGGNLGLICEMVPEFQLLLERGVAQPKRLSPSEEQARFREFLPRLLAALASASRPVLLFLDDLQWADDASLRLLHELAALRPPHLLTVVSYRSDEVAGAHPVRLALERVGESVEPAVLTLAGLDEGSVYDLLAATLKRRDDEVRALSELVHAKTDGNPFFVGLFVTAAHEGAEIWLDPAARQWRWDSQALSNRASTQNVVELIASRLDSLDPGLRYLLGVAACMGSRFDVETLAAVVADSAAAGQDPGGPVGEVEQHLDHALRLGLVRRSASDRGIGTQRQPDRVDTLEFAHDRVQHTATGLLSAAHQAAVHLALGRRLRATLSRDMDDRTLYEVVDHLNRGVEPLADPAEVVDLAELNARAAEAARTSNAYAASLGYVAAAERLLGDDDWDTHYKLRVRLAHTAATSSYLSQDFGAVDALVATLAKHARDVLDEVPAHEARFASLTARNRFDEALDSALVLLKRLGSTLPARPGTPATVRGLLATQWRMRKLTPTRLSTMPRMADPTRLAAMRILANCISPSFLARPNLFPILVFEMVRLSLRHGNCPASINGYLSYAIITVGVLGDADRALELGTSTLALADDLDATDRLCVSRAILAAFLLHWRRPLRETLPHFERGFRAGIDSGDLDFAPMNAVSYCYYALHAGVPLSEFEARCIDYLEPLQRMAHTHFIRDCQRGIQLARNLMGRSDDPMVMKSAFYDEDECWQIRKDAGDVSSIASLAYYRALLSFLFGKYARAEHFCEEAEANMAGLMASMFQPAHEFLYALVLAQRGFETTKARARYRKAEARLRKWAGWCPENQGHRVELLRAERWRHAGKASQAAAAYERAIDGAQRHGFRHEAAIALELSSRFYAQTGQGRAAHALAAQAVEAYRAWGATAKADQLVREASGRAQTGPHAPPPGEGLRNRGALESALDLSAVLRATQSISGQVSLEELQRDLLRVVLAHSGAARGLLFLGPADLLVLEAEAKSDPFDVAVDLGTPIGAVTRVEKHALSLAARTGEPVLVSDATREAGFEHDAHVLTSGVRSLLVVPISTAGTLRGVLYLENSLPGVFTAAHVEVLHHLATQAAISFDNAALVKRLEQRVAARTVELEGARELAEAERLRSDHLLLNVLPASIAEELRQTGEAKPVLFADATIMFTDFVGFTAIASEMTPNALVRGLDECFRAFDEIVLRFGLEKLKTVGDGYLCAAGLPTPNKLHAESAIRAALACRDFMDQWAAERSARGLPTWQVRIGVNSGPVVAGVIGRHKFSYDVWGDTVNTASRVESAGHPGRVNISEATRELTAGQFTFEDRGVVPIKGKQAVRMYFVEHKRAASDGLVAAVT